MLPEASGAHAAGGLHPDLGEGGRRCPGPPASPTPVPGGLRDLLRCSPATATAPATGQFPIWKVTAPQSLGGPGQEAGAGVY